ncbi:MAG: glycosyltransferase family 2 protein [Chromatiales bacterium]
MFESVLIVLTLASMLLILYHHAGFPLIMRLARRRQPYSEPRLPARNYAESRLDSLLPPVTILIPAYNEERWIADKIRNLAALDYPHEKLRIIVACDGCEDRTADVARGVASEAFCRHLSLQVREFMDNRGKVAVVNEIMQEIDTEFVALSDVSSLISIDALQIAAWHFQDPRLGVLNGSYRLLEPGSEGEVAYWSYQGNIKMSEAALGATIGAHGAFYLFRRHLFEPLAADTINDDFILPMNIVARGYRAGYEPAISILELEGSNVQTDRQRRLRISAGNLQQLIRLKHLLSPRYRGVAFVFLSGKALRVAMPFLMIAAFAGSLLLAGGSRFFMILAVAQLLFYGLATWQLVTRRESAGRYLKLMAYFVDGHLATLNGILRYLLGLERGRWQRVITKSEI